MPVIQPSSYRAKGIFRNQHLNTMHAVLLRKYPTAPYKRIRINTPDDDFLDLDCILQKNKKVIILLHGLEGNSKRPYMQGMAYFFMKNGWDVVSMNFRGCSGEPNLLPRSYHIGETGDLDLVVKSTLNLYPYEQVSILGFSMGGNMVLKYLGEQGNSLMHQIKSAVAISVPVDVVKANLEIDRWYNWHYRKNLVNSLNETYKIKMDRFPEQFSLPPFGWPTSFEEFDDYYTAPVHGFDSAQHYWDVSSSLHFIPDITIPTLLINAKDDTFLSDTCYPFRLAEQHPMFYLETPDYGGHLGFVSSFDDGSYWTERRALEFIRNQGR
jgi:predicted alpha/beta-fold hydrolase